MTINKNWFLAGLIIIFIMLIIKNYTRFQPQPMYKSQSWGSFVEEARNKQLERLHSVLFSKNKIIVETKRLPIGNNVGKNGGVGDYSSLSVIKPKDVEVKIEEGKFRIKRLTFPKKLEIDLTYSQRLNIGLGLRFISFDWWSIGAGVSNHNAYAKLQRFITENTKLCLTWGMEYAGFSRWGAGVSIDL